MAEHTIRRDATEETDDARDAGRPVKHERRTTKHDTHERKVIDESLQRSRYGGFHFGAAFFGWLVATGMSVFLIALISAIGGGFAALAGTRTAELEQNAAQIGIGAAIAAAVLLALAYYAGGYVAGRMSRFNGARQGVGVWVIGAVIAVVLAIVGGLAGSNLDAIRQVSLPGTPVDAGAITAGSIITLVASALITLLAALAGGKMGERYHRKIDRAGSLDD